MSGSASPAFARWRDVARRCLAQDLRPEHASFADADAPGLFDAEQPPAAVPRTTLRIPRALLDLLERVACHREDSRHALMYRALWRATHGEPRLLDDAADDDVIALARMARAVDRAAHKMTAFVRFRELATPDGARFVAWFEPEHDVLHRTAPFFVRRFGAMFWTIATPDGIVSWDRHELAFRAPDASLLPPAADAAELLWLAYYEAIFNPARLNLRAMRREMPQRYWRNLPEAARIVPLVAQASERAGRMIEETLDRDVAPFGSCSAAMRDRTVVETPASCRRCELGRTATQAVQGEGPADARIVLVGEQPGDEEDIAGRPFIGPAGRVLRDAIAAAGLDVAQLYMTNAVKHFRFEPRGKRRIHKTPAQRHVEACGAWLDDELRSRNPSVIVALGATALGAVTGRRMSIADARSLALPPRGSSAVVAT